jgi:hypothetical protein
VVGDNHNAKGYKRVSFTANLDCMGDDELERFIKRHKTDVRYTKHVEYARLSIEAYDARLRGAINHAIRLERRADTLYEQIPEQCRW